MFDASPAGRLVFIGWLFLPAALAVLALMLLERRPAARVRRFWCGTAGRGVEVTFIGNTVQSCSAFTPVEAVTCARACADPRKRRRERGGHVVAAMVGIVLLAGGILWRSSWGMLGILPLPIGLSGW